MRRCIGESFVPSRLNIRIDLKYGNLYNATNIPFSLLLLDLNNLNVTFSCYCFLLVPSRAPSYISLTDVESTRIKVTWNPVPRQYHNGRLLGYKVYFRETAYYSNPSESSSSSITVSNPNATYVTLTGLLPGQRYDVSVAAFTSKGVGPRSYRYYVTTGR